MVSSISKTNNQPNQAPKKEEIDYNDKSKWTYPLNDKQISIIQDGFIDSEIYNLLPDEKKINYIPKPLPINMASLIKLLSDFGILATLLAPIFDVLKSLPKPNPFEKILVIFKTIDKLLDIISAIETLEDVPVIGTLASPVVRALRYIVEFFMSLFYAVIMLIDGTLMVLFKLRNDIPKIEERIKAMTTDGETPDELQSWIDKFKEGVLDPFMSTKEWNQLMKELNSLVQPINDIYSLSVNMTEKFSMIVDSLQHINQNGKNFMGDKICKIVLGKTWHEMELEAQERVEKEFNRGPLPKLFDIIEKLDKLMEQKYIDKDDYEMLKNHKKALKKQQAEKDLTSKILDEYTNVGNFGNDFSKAWEYNYDKPKSTISK